MSWWDTLANWAGEVGDTALHSIDDFNNAMGKLAGYADSIVNGIAQFLDNPIAGVERAAADESAFLTRTIMGILTMIQRIEAYIQTQEIDPLKTWTQQQLSFLRALVWANFDALWRLIYQVNEQTVTTLDNQLYTEQQARIKGDQLSEAYTRAQVKAALILIQQAAASGYNATTPARKDILTRLADELVTRDPLVRDLAGRIIQYALDLASIEDPIARITLGFLLKNLIDKLGLDKAIGELLDALLTPIIGQPTPKNLHDVIYDIGTRLNATEAQWAEFMNDGGPEILQAGEQWKAITSIPVDIGIAAFFGTMVADPQQWANDVSEVIGPVVREATTGINDTMRHWR